MIWRLKCNIEQIFTEFMSRDHAYLDESTKQLCDFICTFEEILSHGILPEARNVAMGIIQGKSSSLARKSQLSLTISGLNETKEDMNDGKHFDPIVDQALFWPCIVILGQRNNIAKRLLDVSLAWGSFLKEAAPLFQNENDSRVSNNFPESLPIEQVPHFECISVSDEHANLNKPHDRGTEEVLSDSKSSGVLINHVKSHAVRKKRNSWLGSIGDIWTSSKRSSTSDHGQPMEGNDLNQHGSDQHLGVSTVSGAVEVVSSIANGALETVSSVVYGAGSAAGSVATKASTLLQKVWDIDNAMSIDPVTLFPGPGRVFLYLSLNYRLLYHLMEVSFFLK